MHVADGASQQHRPGAPRVGFTGLAFFKVRWLCPQLLLCSSLGREVSGRSDQCMQDRHTRFTIAPVGQWIFDASDLPDKHGT
jgi:hypothetical protein